MIVEPQRPSFQHMERITDVETGRWCDHCLLPSAVAYAVAVAHRGPVMVVDRTGAELMNCQADGPTCVHVLAVEECQEAHQPQEV